MKFKFYFFILTVLVNINLFAFNRNTPGLSMLPAPVPCTFTTSQDIGTTLLITWTPFANANLYAIQYRLPGGSWIGSPAYTNQAKLSNLTPNTTYECRIYIYINGTFWNTSQIGTFTTGSTTYQTAFDMGNVLQVSWNNYSPWITSYSFQYRMVGAANWTGITSLTNFTKLTDLVPNSDYECKVHTYIGNTLWGICQHGFFHTNDMNITSNQDMGTTALFQWTNLSWSSNYVFQYKLLSAPGWTGTPAPTNQSKIAGLIPKTSYTFRVIVYKNGTVWGTSAEDTIVTNKIFFSNLNDNATSVEVGWSANIPISTWATSYILQYNLPQTTAWYSSPNSPTNSVTISPVIGGQDYLVRLRVYIGPTFWGTSQVEKIGRYSPVVLKHFTTEQLLPFPNPFNSQFQVNISTKTESECHWDIFDLNGRKIKQGSYNLKPGDNSLNFDVAEIASGNYLLNLNIEGSTQIFKLIKN